MTTEASPVMAARRIIMSAYLYYRHDSPVLSDGDYDGLQKLAVDRWSELEPLLQWQLGSQKAIAATGFHVKMTQLAEAAAWRWFEHEKGTPILSSAGPIVRWKMSKRWRLRYASII